MKICYVLNQFPELSQTFVIRQIIHLLEQGHQVDVIAARPGAEASHHESLWRRAVSFGLDRRTLYTGMPDNLVRRALRGAALMLRRGSRHPGIVATGLDARRFGWFAVTGSLLAMGLPLAGERRRYDAIVAHFGPQGVLAQALREMHILDGPLVTFFHAYDLTSAPRLAGRHMYRRLFERGELQLAISQRGAELLRRLGAAPEKIGVHHMGVSPVIFHPPSEPRARGPREAARVVSIGRLVAKKGFDGGLRAVANANARGARLEYSIYGSGPLSRTLDQAIDRLGLRGTARLCGPASQDALAEVLRSSDIFLAPSITSRDGDEEGIPIVLMEAMASGLAVVATDSGGVAELVAHDRSGLLVAEHDIAAMARALARLSASPQLAQQLGQAGRQRVLVDFNEGEQGRRLVDTLASLTAPRCRRGPAERNERLGSTSCS